MGQVHMGLHDLEMLERRHAGGHVEYRVHQLFEVMQLYLEAVDVEIHGAETNC